MSIIKKLTLCVMLSLLIVACGADSENSGSMISTSDTVEATVNHGAENQVSQFEKVTVAPDIWNESDSISVDVNNIPDIQEMTDIK